MKIPTEITYHHLEKTEAIDSLVREKIAKLEQFCDYMNSCRVVIEKTHDHPKMGSPYRVRLDITVPPGHELAVDRSPDEGIQYEALETVIREAFDAARRQLVELVERQRQWDRNSPSQQQMVAIVTQLFTEEGYGFLRTIDVDREIYFHKNSVLNNDFERLTVGTGVRYVEEQGENGPQATTVKIVNKPGVSAEKASQTEMETPLGWNS
ncbi:'Cold-shock' DNA-binding domain protein [Lyngbya aestuarii BL J]|uniref:'Cold-shock' DNA-binding domain protein n=1 Tax=Lyngbya aestuarii BL J TaxID=1348334 RepID=U7QRP6_9CYAN|nr:HPF/RaiA family ribosome-associated protein [Lyngbya aestuarii]ERT09937.1 'Cold-shock' DNA-binding domain protein [Lyngbya aestuarii BL J]